MSAYDDAVLADQPVCYVKLDEPAGATQAIDYGSNGVPWTYAQPRLGQPGLFPDAVGSAMNPANRVTGIASLATVPAGLNQWTLEAWINVGSDPFYQTLYAVSIGHVGNTVGANTYIGTGSFYPGEPCYIGAQASNASGSMASNPVTTTQHAVLRFDGTSRALFLNGVAVTNFSTTKTALLNGTVSVGGLLLNGSWYSTLSETTRVSHVAIYPGALSDARIAAHYQAATNPPAPVVPVEATPDLVSGGTYIEVDALTTNPNRTNVSGSTDVTASATVEPAIRVDGHSDVSVEAFLVPATPPTPKRPRVAGKAPAPRPIYNTTAVRTPLTPQPKVLRFDAPTLDSTLANRDAVPTASLDALRAACHTPARLPNPLRSPGCSPVLRAILTRIGIPYTVIRELANDADPHSHAGGNALDVDGPAGPLQLATFLRAVPQLFAAALWYNPHAEDDSLFIWDGHLTTADTFSMTALLTYTDTLHLSSSTARLYAALGQADVRATLIRGMADA